MDSLEGDHPSKVFIDPNTLSEDGTVALSSYSWSECGDFVAMAFSTGGTDWRTVNVHKVDQESGERQQLGDELQHVKFTSLAWTHDSRGFFYNAYAPPNTSDAGTETDKNANQQLRYHIVGRPREEDPTVLAIPEHPEWMIGASVSHDGRYLILTISSGCEPTNRLWAVDLEEVPRDSSGALDFSSVDFYNGTRRLSLLKIVDDFRASWEYLGSGLNGEWTLLSNLDAPRYKLVRGNVMSAVANAGRASWEEVVAEHEKDVLQWVVRLEGNCMVCCFLSDVKSVLHLRDFASGELIKDIRLPGIGSVSGFSGNRKSSEFLYSFVSFTEPQAQYRGDAKEASSFESVLYRRISLNLTPQLEPDLFETHQYFVPSADGTKIPMFVTCRRGMELSGDAPTLLYGYGGFNISLEPSFSVARLCWLLAYDGVVAVANLRGGGEYGTEWRDAGSLGNKQNVFDDFQACAEWLQKANYCSPKTTVIQGGSNGGLLVAACINQRPDLFACGLAQVGVMDMLRFKHFTIGHAWCTDYGDVDDPEAFSTILRYSPLHNVVRPKSGQYPALLMCTGDHDDRVVPLHTYKLLAQLHHVLGNEGGTQTNPILARIDVKVGHGAGKPTQKIIEEVSDMLSFAATAVGAEWKYKDSMNGNSSL